MRKIDQDQIDGLKEEIVHLNGCVERYEASNAAWKDMTNRLFEANEAGEMLKLPLSPEQMSELRDGIEQSMYGWRGAILRLSTENQAMEKNLEAVHTVGAITTKKATLDPTKNDRLIVKPGKGRPVAVTVSVTDPATLPDRNDSVTLEFCTLDSDTPIDRVFDCAKGVVVVKSNYSLIDLRGCYYSETTPPPERSWPTYRSACEVRSWSGSKTRLFLMPYDYFMVKHCRPELGVKVDVQVSWW